MKKRERTVNLVNESEILESQNKELKSQVNDLENQRRKLMEVLQAHGPECVHHNGYQPLPSLSTITNNNCKYLNDLNYLDQPEIKYSECLKQQPAQDSPLLPPGYCKLSPTEGSYVLSPDSGFVKSPSDVPTVDLSSYHHQQSTPKMTNSDYIPNCEMSPKTRGGKKTPATSTVTTSSSDFILKNELIENTSSPYTTVQSADRFLFDSSNYNNNNNNNNSSNNNNYNNDKLTAAIKDNSSNNLLEFNGNFIKSDYCQNNLLHHHHQQNNHHNHNHHHHLQSLQNQLQNHHPHQQHHQQQSHHHLTNHHNDYLLLSDPDGSDTQFTDLDSGLTSYTNMNGGCLV